MEGINPVEWFAWIYGKVGHPVIGGIVVVTVFGIFGLLLWVRGIDKYKEEHPVSVAVVAPIPSGPQITFIGGKIEDNGIGVLNGNSSTSINFNGTIISGNDIAFLDLPSDMTAEQASIIVQTLIEKFKQSHKGQQPSYNWINKRLKSQGKNFQVAPKK